jgi:CRP/FNR family cyclic AMP-dependent transcriptional regulator
VAISVRFVAAASDRSRRRNCPVDVSQLKRVPLFADVPEESLKKIAPFTEVDEFAEGVTVMREGGFSNDFYVIEEGTGEVTRDGEKVAEVGPGDVIGEEGLLEKSQRSATITATSTMRVIKIEHWELSRMKKSMPDVVERLRELVEKRQSD